MATLTHIAVHHAGGTGTDNLASTVKITPAQVNDYHKSRWNFPSKFIPGQYGGYNFMYSPVTRTFHQFRALGEETAAQVGWNNTAVSIMIGGNYSKGADEMHEYVERDIAKFIHKLIHNPYEHVVAPGSVFDLSITRIHPHRWYQAHTDCYGNALTEAWLANILATYVITSDDELKKRIFLLKQIIALYIQLKAAMLGKDAKIASAFAGPFDNRTCDGFIDLT